MDKPEEKFLNETLSNLKHNFLYFEWFVSEKDEANFFQFLDEMGLVVLYKLFRLYISKEKIYEGNLDTWFISKKMVE